MKVFYDFVVAEELKKVKKPELVKFTREILKVKIPTSEKKEVFYKEVLIHSADKRIGLKKYIKFFNWNLKVSDIVKTITDDDIYYAISILKQKINHLYYQKSIAKSKEEDKNILKYIRKLFNIRNDVLIKLINLKKISISGIMVRIAECERPSPIYVDTVTNKQLQINRYILFPNMKYCRVPKKKKPLDLNNIKFLGDYKEVNTREVVNKSYIVEVNGYQFLLACNYKSELLDDIVDDDKLPTVEYQPMEKTLVNTPVDDLEYQKAIYIIHRFLKGETNSSKIKNKNKSYLRFKKYFNAKDVDKIRVEQERQHMRNARKKASKDKKRKNQGNNLN